MFSRKTFSRQVFSRLYSKAGLSPTTIAGVVVALSAVTAGAVVAFNTLQAKKKRRLQTAIEARANDPELASLLSQYVDLVNSEGQRGTGPRKFLQEHRGNEPLVELCKRSRDVQAWLKTEQPQT